MQCQGSRVKMMVDALPKRLQGITIKIESNLKVTNIIKRTIDMRHHNSLRDEMLKRWEEWSY